jgi:hypothetical protein
MPVCRAKLGMAPTSELDSIVNIAIRIKTGEKILPEMITPPIIFSPPCARRTKKMGGLQQGEREENVE